MEQLKLWDGERIHITIEQYHAISRQAADCWNVARAEASKAYDVAIQQDHSIQGMIAADRRRDKAIQKADAILASTMKLAYDSLR